MGQRPGPAHRPPGQGLAQPVGIGGALHLDDLGAEVGEQPAELAAGDDDAEVENAQPVERARSLGSVPASRRGRRAAPSPMRRVGADARAGLAQSRRARRRPRTGPLGTAIRPIVGCDSVCVSAPTARKCSDANASAGLNTAAMGTPRRCPSATSSSIVWAANSSRDRGVELLGRGIAGGDRLELGIGELVRAHRARPASRATDGPTAGRSGRIRRGRRMSGRSADSVGVRATARPRSSARRRPGPRSRKADPEPARPPRTGRSRCTRLGRSAIGGSRRRARPRRPARRRWPTRCPAAAARAVPWWDRTATVRSTSRRARRRWPASDACGPAVPKSVTDSATRCPNRSASSAADVPNAAAPPGPPPSTTMSAPAASSRNRSRSTRVVRVEHDASLVRVVQRERHADAPPTAGRAARGGRRRTARP